MSCDGAAKLAYRPARRGVVGWLLLIVLAGLAAFYALVVSLIADQPVDEAYRRTFLTAEFSVYPEADGWRPGDGLDYRVGSFADLRLADQRTWLSRFGWRRVDTPSVTLKGFSGRLFLKLFGETDAIAHRHRLTMGFTCRFPPGHGTRIYIAVNGSDVGSVICDEGIAVADAMVPAGRFGFERYDQIAIRRSDGSLFEHVLTRLGFRADAVALDWFKLDAE